MAVFSLPVFHNKQSEAFEGTLAGRVLPDHGCTWFPAANHPRGQVWQDMGVPRDCFHLYG